MSMMAADIAPYKLPKRLIRLVAWQRHVSGKGVYRRALAIAADAQEIA